MPYRFRLLLISRNFYVICVQNVNKYYIADQMKCGVYKMKGDEIS